MEDRISDLPDSIIHYILSFLPSIKEAIQTCVLSKRWKNQWTSVPVLTFNLLELSEEYASRFIYSALVRYDCPKIKKFRVIIDCDFDDEYPHIVEGIRFAVRKNAEEIVLDLFECEFKLPDCIFNHSSLVNLNMSNCELKPKGKVCWENLKELYLGCCLLSDKAVHNILCGSPVLESLVFETCFGCESDHIVIDSKSLKKLELGLELSALEISCPNLEQLNLVNSFSARSVKFVDFPSLNHATVYSAENIDDNAFMDIFQHLKHVKDLKLGTCFLEFLSGLEDSFAQSLPLWNNKCLTLRHPNFNEHTNGIALALYYSHFLEKIQNRPYEADTNVHFNPLQCQVPQFEWRDKRQNVAFLKNQTNRNVTRGTEGTEASVFAYFRGLYLTFATSRGQGAEFPGNEEENYWYWDLSMIKCLESSLKFVEILNFSRRDPDYEQVLNFIEFVLRNAKALEKLVVVFEKDDEDFEFQVSLALCRFRRCSPRASVELLHYV